MSQDSSHSHFVIPLKFLLSCFVALLILTVVTVLAALIDLGPTLNLTLALFIAGIKAFCVLYIFMGLKWDKGYNVLVVLASILFILIFIVFIILDFSSRGDIESIESGSHSIQSPVKTPSSEQSYDSH